MKKQIINDKLIENFLLHLISEERSAATISVKCRNFVSGAAKLLYPKNWYQAGRIGFRHRISHLQP